MKNIEKKGQQKISQVIKRSGWQIDWLIKNMSTLSKNKKTIQSFVKYEIKGLNKELCVVLKHNLEVPTLKHTVPLRPWKISLLCVFRTWSRMYLGGPEPSLLSSPHPQMSNLFSRKQFLILNFATENFDKLRKGFYPWIYVLSSRNGIYFRRPCYLSQSRQDIARIF